MDPLDSEKKNEKMNYSDNSIKSTVLMPIRQSYTANAYRQTTDKLMFKSVISTVRWIRK